MSKSLSNQLPESIELIKYIQGTGNLSKHLCEVFKYAILATASGTEDLPVNVCGSLNFVSELAERIGKLEIELKQIGQ